MVRGGRRNRDGRMPLREHLRELRTRLMLAVGGILVGAVAGWIWYLPIFDQLQGPITELAEARGELIALNFGGVATPLDMQIKVALFAGVILSSPWWLYQLWAFVTPGLTRRERWYAVGFLAAGLPLFLVGAGIAWWVLPKAVALLSGFTPPQGVNLIPAQTYLEFIMRMVLAFGLAFLVPVVMVGLTFAGVVRARTWQGGWRWAVMLAFVFAAVATPTGDAISMFALAIPICALYAAAVGVCHLRDRRADRRDADGTDDASGPDGADHVPEPGR